MSHLKKVNNGVDGCVDKRIKEIKEKEEKRAFEIYSELSQKFKMGYKEVVSSVYESSNLIVLLNDLLLKEGFNVKIVKGCRDYKVNNNIEFWLDTLDTNLSDDWDCNCFSSNNHKPSHKTSYKPSYKPSHKPSCIQTHQTRHRPIYKLIVEL